MKIYYGLYKEWLFFFFFEENLKSIFFSSFKYNFVGRKNMEI